MVLDAVSNFVRGRADAQLTAGTTTLSVEDASIFPDPAADGEYNLVIWDANNFPRPDQDGDVEIVRVTARDTGADELTVERGQETTSDVAHPEGSAVHLSPTAKMFTDIEDTFTTEAEAADAAPVQSVFDRVGDVVAETGDYAATQISNFGSEVLSSIDGSSISPSDITGLWDGSVVAADVDNKSVSTEQARIANAVWAVPGEKSFEEAYAEIDAGGTIIVTGTHQLNEEFDAEKEGMTILGLGDATLDLPDGDRFFFRSDGITAKSVTIKGRDTSVVVNTDFDSERVSWENLTAINESDTDEGTGVRSNTEEHTIVGCRFFCPNNNDMDGFRLNTENSTFVGNIIENSLNDTSDTTAKSGNQVV